MMSVLLQELKFQVIVYRTGRSLDLFQARIIPNDLWTICSLARIISSKQNVCPIYIIYKSKVTPICKIVCCYIPNTPNVIDSRQCKIHSPGCGGFGPCSSTSLLDP
ncbi:hypothetical protein Dimus_003282 [Dionaea muscipula]